jgi:VWFA-related protein
LRGSATADNDRRGIASDQTSQSLPDEGEGEIVVAIETNLVTIPVSVFDRNGLYIPNLRRSDFRIFEDGEEQKIEYFGTTDEPFTVALMIDTSPSTEYRIEEIRQAAIAFVDQLKPQDQVIVIEFNGSIRVRSERTGDRQQIYRAINRTNWGGGTSLYDAVDIALRRQLARVEGRKAVVLFTDGVDTTSRRASYDTTIDFAEEFDAPIFPIYYNTFFETSRGVRQQWPFPGTVRSNAPGTTAAEYAVGKKYLEELASYTGGRVFRPEATPGGLTRAFQSIAEELRRQYNIGYIPEKDGSPGQRKQIRVRVNRPNIVVRARDSYIVPDKPNTATLSNSSQR